MCTPSAAMPRAGTAHTILQQRQVHWVTMYADKEMGTQNLSPCCGHRADHHGHNASASQRF